MHRAYRLLLDSAPPLQVFVSHAVRDGLEISHRFCEYLNRRTDLTYFISQRDIASGDQFAEVIEKAVGECALLAVLTDAYSARPWCQREVLAAKDNMLPVVVLDALSDGTARLFPYLGNAPVVRWREDSPETMEKIVGKLLDTALRRTYFPIRAAQVCGAHRLPVPDGLVWQPPELATALEHSRRVTTRDDTAAETDENRATLLYPDPPLGTDETRLLRRLVPDCEPVTLTALLASAGL
ncbi:toll/interleukin-1 receptor domain-containing protein [Frankia sp. EI5c]|uniref:toll/interleukin-1 receptor domain-containing protein n=1 Tax=Frankia sp. EI5c TaxID=683316 RepID=UPI0037BE6512